jgi:hypothetical protein
MTLPAFKGVGTGSETTPTWPTHAAGDFALLFVEYGNINTSIDTPAGWTLLPGAPFDPGSSFNSLQTVFYRFATSSSETNPTLTHSGVGTKDHKWGAIVTYTGVNTSTPVHAQTSGFAAPADTALSFPGVTTLLDDCMIVHALTWSADNAGPLVSTQANAGLGSVSERYDGGTVTGNGGGICIFDGTLASHTTIANSTATASVAIGGAMLVLALCAADKTLPTLSRKSTIINTAPGM